MNKDLLKISSGLTIKDMERKERLDALAIYVSPLPWFNIDLLNKLYINIFEKYFKKDLDEDGQHSFETRSITCADFISSSDVRRIDYNAFELDKNKRKILRKEINKDKKVLLEIGQFMIAYSESNHHNFLSPKYREVLNIEGLIIIDPSSAASEISSHISNQLNQNTDSNSTFETAKYYLNIINKNSKNPGIKELKKYLEGRREWAKGNTENALQKFKGLKDGSESSAKTITVKLPQSVQKEIKANYKKLNKLAIIDKVGRGICLVHVNKIIGNGILLNGGYLLTANHLIKSLEDAKNTNINFRNKNKELDSTYGVEYELDPSGYFITMSHDDLDFTIVKIKDHPTPTLSLIPVPALTEDEVIPRKNVITIQITSQEFFKSAEGSILDTSDTRVYHDIVLDIGGSGSPVFDQEGKILGMNVSSYRAKGGSRAEAIRIDRIKAELNALGIDINNLSVPVKSSNLYCVLVGNNEYEARNIDPLRGAIKDAKRMQNFIQSNLSYASLKLIQNASRQEIIEAFFKVEEELKEGDTLLFYFAGYGGKTAGQSFIATNDMIPYVEKTNRLYDSELDGFYQQLILKGIEIVSILDCGFNEFPTRGSLELSETNYGRSLMGVYDDRGTSRMTFDRIVRPNKISNGSLISISAASESEDVLEHTNGGVFMDRFIMILSNPEFDRGRINVEEFSRHYNSHNDNLVNKQTLGYTIRHISNPVPFEKQFLFGDDLVERRIEIAKKSGELDLSGIDLMEVPDSIHKIEGLRHLNLSHNKIEGGFSRLLVMENENIRWDRALRRLNKILILNVENNPIGKIEELALLVMICKDVRYNEEHLTEKEKTFLKDLKLVDPMLFKKINLKDNDGLADILNNISEAQNSELISVMSQNRHISVGQLVEILRLVFEVYESLSDKSRDDLLQSFLSLDPDYSNQQPSEGYDDEGEKLSNKSTRQSVDNNAKKLYELGLLKKDQSLFEEALEYFEKAIEIDPYNYAIYMEAGIMNRELGNNYKAIEYLNKSLEGPENIFKADSYNELGLAYNSRSEYHKALEFYQKAIQMYQEFRDEDSDEIATCLSNMGFTYNNLGDYEHAIKCYNEALTINIRIHGAKHASLVNNYSALSTIYTTLNEYNKAHDYADRAQAIRDRLNITDGLDEDPVNIFISYAQKDAHYQEELLIHMKSMVNDEAIFIQSNDELVHRMNWLESITRNFKNADIALFLVSADSLASEYFYEEITIAIERYNKKETIIVPVILRPCLWEKSELGKFQVLPRDARPIVEWNDRSSAYKDVVFGLNEVIQEVKKRKSNLTNDREQSLDNEEEEKIDLFETIETNREIQSEILNLEGLDLDYLPEEVFQLTHLKTLDLSNNNIRQFPKEISRLVNLEELHLSNNAIGDFHADLGNLINLKILKLDNCDLDYFPESLIGLHKLDELNLSHNKIKFVPNQLRNWANLRKLDLTENTIFNFEVSDLGKHNVEFLNTLPEIEDSNYINSPVIMVIGMDYENNLPNIVPEINEIGEIFQGSELEVVKLFNPTAPELNRMIHKYQNRLAILHIASYSMESIDDGNNELHEMKPQDWVEFFRCVRTERFDTPLLFLNCCYGEDIINLLLKDTFKLVIGIKDLIDDREAFHFGVKFYASLVLEKKTIAEAIDDMEENLIV